MSERFFKPQTVLVGNETVELGGNTYNFKFPTNSLCRGITILLKQTLTGAVADSSFDGVKAFFDTVDLSGTYNGSTINPINGVKSAQITDLMQLVRKRLTPIPDVSGTGSSVMAFEVDFMQPEFGLDNLLMYSGCLPTLNMSDLTLTLTTADQADIDADSTPTYDGTFTVEIYSHQFHAKTLPRVTGTDQIAVPFIETEINGNRLVSGTDYGSELTNLTIQKGGKYSHVLLRGIASATAKQAETTAFDSGAPFNTAVNKGVRLLDTGDTVRSFDTFYTLRRNLQAGLSNDLVAGNIGYAFAWRGTNGLLDSRVYQTGESVIKFRTDTVTSSGGKIDIVTKRWLDSQNLLG
jgi:hypothetical protein